MKRMIRILNAFEKFNIEKRNNFIWMWRTVNKQLLHKSVWKFFSFFVTTCSKDKTQDSAFQFLSDPWPPKSLPFTGSTPSLSLTHTLCISLLSLYFSLSPSLLHIVSFLSLSLSLSHTHTNTLPVYLSHIHKHTVSLSLSLSLSPTLSYVFREVTTRKNNATSSSSPVSSSSSPLLLRLLTLLSAKLVIPFSLRLLHLIIIIKSSG